MIVWTEIFEIMVTDLSVHNHYQLVINKIGWARIQFVFTSITFNDYRRQKYDYEN